jgi:hypothetical protein
MPNPQIAGPHAATEASSMRPAWRALPIQPLVSAPASAPAAGPMQSKPTAAARPWNVPVPMAGNKALGTPKTMALRPISNSPATSQ